MVCSVVGLVFFVAVCFGVGIICLFSCVFCLFACVLGCIFICLFLLV